MAGVARRQAVKGLGRAVERAAAFFAGVDEGLGAGRQSAREVLSHLVFWHGEYVRIARALARSRPPHPKSGTFRDWNAFASQSFARESLTALVRRLERLNHELDRALDQIPNWRMNFPLKEGVAYCSVRKRVSQIRAHIDCHVLRLARAKGKGECQRSEYP